MATRKNQLLVHGYGVGGYGHYLTRGDDDQYRIVVDADLVENKRQSFTDLGCDYDTAMKMARNPQLYSTDMDGVETLDPGQVRYGVYSLDKQQGMAIADLIHRAATDATKLASEEREQSPGYAEVQEKASAAFDLRVKDDAQKLDSWGRPTKFVGSKSTGRRIYVAAFTEVYLASHSGYRIGRLNPDPLAVH